MNKKNDVLLSTDSEKAIILGIRIPGTPRWETEEHLFELKELVRTAGATVIESVFQERQRPDSANFVGKGKLEEILLQIEDQDIKLVVFDDELSPAQVRNLEKFFNIKVLDRTGLILDIFAKHAQSSEAKTQVELAQLNYLLPRLTRQWQHLSRQVGGIGTKGPGETQLETDRRLVRTRIARLKTKLKQIDKQSQSRRQHRDSLFRVALVGYTNSGKSTIMNQLTTAETLIEDKLFATLDTKVKRCDLSETATVLLSDTVGFIRKLPTQLIASFRSTLSEAREADVLLHIIDASNPHYEEHIQVVKTLLTDLDIDASKMVSIFNKTDLVTSDARIQDIRQKYPDCVFISALRHIGVPGLKQVLLKRFEHLYKTLDVKLNFNMSFKEHQLRSIATFLEKSHDDEFIYFRIKFHVDQEYKVQQILGALT